MLLLTRKPGQGLTIGPEETLDLSTPIGRLFADGPIRVVVKNVDGEHVRLGVAADVRFLILREELLVRPTAQIDAGARRAQTQSVAINAQTHDRSAGQNGRGFVGNSDKRGKRGWHGVYR